MDDLNADAEKYDHMQKIDHKGKYHILQTLRNYNLYDTQLITKSEQEILKPTWKKNELTQRRIDYIWVSKQLIQNIIKTNVHEEEELKTGPRTIYI